MWKSNQNPMFRSKFSEDIFLQKYAHEGCETWGELCKTLVQDVMQDKVSKDKKDQLINYMQDLKFIPGGRYLYYAGRSHVYRLVGVSVLIIQYTVLVVVCYTALVVLHLAHCLKCK